MNNAVGFNLSKNLYFADFYGYMNYTPTKKTQTMNWAKRAIQCDCVNTSNLIHPLAAPINNKG